MISPYSATWLCGWFRPPLSREPRLIRRKRAKDHGGLKKWIQIYHTCTRPMENKKGGLGGLEVVGLSGP